MTLYEIYLHSLDWSLNATIGACLSLVICLLIGLLIIYK